MNYSAGEIRIDYPDETEGNICEIALEAWHTITISWSGVSISVIVDGEEYTTDVDLTELIAENDVYPNGIGLYCGDTPTAGTSVFFDNLNSSRF